MAPRKSTRRGGKQKEEAKKKDATAVEATNARAVTNDDGTTDDDNDGWTLDHHLVGSTCPTPRLILCPIDSSSVAVALGGASSSNNATAEKSHADDYYSIMQESIQAAAFQPENRMQRKPALGRCLVHGNNTAVHAAAALKEQQQEKEEETKPAAAEEEYCLSVDCLSCDWQPQESSSNNTTNAQTSSNKLMCVPTWHNISMASERIQTVVLDHVMHKVLANLVMVAAIEEIRSHYLRQAAAELLLQTSSSSAHGGGGGGEAADVSNKEQQHHSRSTSTNIGGKSAKKSNTNIFSQLPPRYYSMAPNSYLSPPAVSIAGGKKAEQDASSNNNTTFVLPVQFTPNQLVHRIKQGCSMLYKANQEKLVLLQNNSNNKNLVLADNNAGAAAIVAAAAASGYNEGIRTSSRRIARLQTTTTPIITSTTTTTTITTTTTTTGNAQEAAVTADPGQVPEDWKVRQGGTVAAFLNDLLFTVPKAAATVVVAAKDETLENNDDHADNDDDDDNDANMKEEQPITEPAAEPSDGKADGDKEESEDVQMSSEEEEKSKEDKDDDEDYSPKKDDEEDEDDEEVQADTEEESLEVAESEVEEEEEADDGEEEEDQDNAGNDDDDENVDVVNESNPYLQPTSLAILDWLGRKTAKLCSSSDLQTVFPELLLEQQPPPTKKGKNSSTTTTAAALIEAGVGKSAQELLSFGIDRVIWEKMLSTGVENSNNFSIGSSARLVLQSVSHEKIADLDEWDTAYFGRSPFNLRIVDESLEEAKSRHSADDIALAELAYKEQKAWDQQRYKGIHGGYTTWPSWTVAATAWRTSVAALGEAAAGAPTQPSAGGGAQQQQQQELSEHDQTIAQELAKEEDNVGKRRATRRGGDTAGVFYGKNSNMSQKQLMDTILRLVSNRPMGTLMGLISAIADDSADPLRRMRISLGRLLWKRNQIARRSVHTEWTDQPHWNRLAKGSILSVITNDTDENGASNYDSILEYVRGLHKTELQLRSLVVKHLTDIPISIIAAAADERQGSLESVDDAEFVDPFSIEWQSSGHELLNKFIFRPSHQHQSDSIAPCYWYRIQGFVPPIAATYEEGAGPPERPQIGSAKDTIAVERRVRFRVVPAVPRDVRVAKETPSEPLVLTEGQVRAGLKAAEMERKQSTKSTSTENPFTEVDGSRISLIPTQSRGNVPQIEGLVTGHNTVIEGGIVTQKIQVLPDEKSSRHEAFWATLKTASDGSFLCCIGEDPTEYSVRQFDYDSSSIAFQQCREVIEYLRRQSKAAPFLEPVDPVALNIPHYFDVIKNPMDISTLSQNLEKGVYSIIPPGDAHGTSPVTRMLNGPFRDDLELIMDNAIMFNPPDDWIYKAAVALKKMALKKIENLSHAAEGKSGGFTSQKQKSVYVDEDSDVDMYVYESDQDDDYDGGGSRRAKKRKRASSQKPTREDSSTKAIEKPIRLQNVLSDSVGLRGAFSNIPINSDASTFSLPPEWTSRHSLNKSEMECDGEPESTESSERGELDNLISMHLQTEEKETANLRRSTRAHHEPTSSNGAKKLSMINVEYECDGVPGLGNGENPLPRDRLEVELAREKYHEIHYAKNYLSIQKRVEALAADSNTETGIGLYSEGSFPPYMGRVVPEVGPGTDDVRVTWELRAPYLVPAVRWVLRGLIQSEHLAAVEELPTDSSSGGVIVANHAYHLDPSLNPFEIVDQKELQRRKRANQEEEEEDSEEEIELNEYEKLRAARVARNAERLKALGLA